MAADNNPSTPPVQTQPGAVVAQRPSMLLTALVASLVSLCAIAPVLYQGVKRIPPRIATVDLQALVEEDQAKSTATIGTTGELTEDQRRVLQDNTANFAKRLSGSIDALGLECGCVLVNKAALLGGVTVDYTDEIRKRIAK